MIFECTIDDNIYRLQIIYRTQISCIFKIKSQSHKIIKTFNYIIPNINPNNIHNKLKTILTFS